MRTRKCRVWDKDTKQMIYSRGDPFLDYLAIGLDGKLYSIGDAGYGEGAWCFEEDEKEVMDFVGLADRNNKEIYEGDILEGMNYGSPFSIKWGLKYPDGVYGYTGWITDDDYDDISFSPENAKECKILGNIYENPELLKK